MRDYGKVSPLFWIKGSGRRLRGDHEAQAVAFHLLTGPGSTMTGLYYLPMVNLANELGTTAEKARAALARVTVAGFAYYDDDSEFVWVVNAAEFDLGDGLKLGDKRIDGLIKYLKTFGDHRFVRAFLHRYGERYHLTLEGVISEPLPQGPTKALQATQEGPFSVDRRASESKAIAIDKAITRDIAISNSPESPSAPVAAGEPAVAKKGRTAEQQARSKRVNALYRELYETAEGHAPTGTDQAFNGMIARFADKHADKAEPILRWMFTTPNRKYGQSGWKLALMLADAEPLWRELNAPRKAIENIAAPVANRQLSQKANNMLVIEEALGLTPTDHQLANRQQQNLEAKS